MRVFHVQGDQFTELPTLPEAAPDAGYLWVGISRAEFDAQNASVQAALQRWTGGQLVDLHVSDLLNSQLPVHRWRAACTAVFRASNSARAMPTQR